MTFTLRNGTGLATEPQQPPPSCLSPGTSQSEAHVTQPLILVIDPSRETRHIYAEYFEHHGYAVVQAETAAEGAQLSHALRPDVIVTELSDEQEWVQSVRGGIGSSTGRQASIIACSTRIEATWPYAPHGVHVDCALAKPTSLRTLLFEVQRLLAWEGVRSATEPAVMAH